MKRSTAHLPAARSLLSAVRCEYAEIRLSESDGTTISLSGEQVETFSSGVTIAGSVRVLCNGVWGFVSFNDPGRLERHFSRALEIASSVATSEKTRIRAMRAGPQAGRHPGGAGLQPGPARGKIRAHQLLQQHTQIIEADTDDPRHVPGRPHLLRLPELRGIGDNL